VKVVILAGGLGTRMSEETSIRPKPMVEVGPEPILWHIMKLYERYGYNDFIVCGGYKQGVIKDYFSRYALNHSDVEINLKNDKVKIMSPPRENWNVTVVDTGLHTMTGGRIKRIRRYVESDGDFLLTYGDGLANINIDKLLSHHRRYSPIVTLTAVQPPGRFGSIVLDAETMVKKFTEKPPGDGQWINAGFYVASNKIFDFIEGDQTVLEGDPLEEISVKGQMRAFLHEGFWKPMDTLTDKRKLEDMWFSGNAPWKVWTD
jgi:glucose-1-phosphate cytidylyltransferase